MYQGSGKVKLTGEDNAIDDIAKLFGRPWKQMAGKGKNMQYETKAWKDWLRALISILHISGSAMIGPVSLFGAVEEEAAYWFKRGFSPEEAAREIKNKKGTKSRQPGSDEQPEEIEHESDTWGGKSQKKSIEKPSDQKANVKEQLEPGTTPQAFVDRIADAWSTGNRGDLLAYSVRLAQSCSPLNLDIASKEKLRKLLQDREFFRAVGHIVQGLTKSHESWHQKQSRLKKLK